MSILYLVQHFNAVLLFPLKLCGVVSTDGKLSSFEVHKFILYVMHHFCLVLFLGVVFYRLALVLLDRHDKLKRMKIYGARPDERFGSMVFVSCGLLAYVQNTIELWLWIKIILVIGSYVLARLAVDRLNKKLAVLSLAGFFSCYAISKIKLPTYPKYNYIELVKENPTYSFSGRSIYENECQNCHGPNGNAMALSSANLMFSGLDTMQTVAVIMNGRNEMPSYRDRINNAQAKDLAAYIMGFKDPHRKSE